MHIQKGGWVIKLKSSQRMSRTIILDTVCPLYSIKFDNIPSPKVFFKSCSRCKRTVCRFPTVLIIHEMAHLDPSHEK